MNRRPARMEEDSEYSRRPVQPKLSLTPSWIMLGFVLGALTVFFLPRRDPQPAPPLPPAPVAAPSPPLRLTTIESVFAEWGAFAVWENSTTEVALWNTEQRGFTDFHEVRRVGETLYFRTIPRLTRRIVNRGQPLPESCPLQFTETEEHYREWLEQGRPGRMPSRGASAPVGSPPMTPVDPKLERAPAPPLAPPARADAAPARTDSGAEGGRR